MFQSRASVRWLTTVMLATLVACGTVQGATPGQADVQFDQRGSDVHLTEFGPSDSRSPAQLGGDASGNSDSGPSLVP